MMPVVKNPSANVEEIRDTGSLPGFRKIPWRRAWQPTPVFLPGESHRQRNLAGHSPWGVTKSDDLAQHRAGMNLETGRNECSETAPGRPLQWILKTVEL